MYRIYFDTFIPANYEKLVKDVVGFYDLSIRDEDANNIFEKVLSLNEKKYKHPLGDIIIETYGLLGDSKKIKEIAKERGVSRSRIDYLIAIGLRMLRHPKRNRPFERLSRDGLEREIKLLRERLDKNDVELANAKEELRKMKYKEKHGHEEAQEDIPLFKEFGEDDSFFISRRARNCLHNEGIKNLSELANKKEEEVAKIKGLGRKTFNEIKEFLWEFGLSFAK
jgi:hypothetical protein